MDLYYVESGDIKVKIAADNPMDAAVRALNMPRASDGSTNGIQLDRSDKFFVDQFGFRGKNSLYHLRTSNVLKQAGWEDCDE